MRPNDQVTALPDVKPKWSGERRQQFIDFRLQWDGRLNRSDLVKFFDISVPQASKDIAAYMKANPGNIGYDKSSKTYVALEAFAPAFPTSGPSQYLAQLLALDQAVLSPEQSPIGFRPPTASVPIPERTVDTAVLKQLVHAIEAGLMLQLEYQSITRDEPRSRSISPHAFVHDGQRWHVRAYCHLRQRFDDIVIGRILNVKGSRPSSVSPLDDGGWHEHVELVLVPHPDLTPEQRHGVEVDYKMKKGRAALMCKRAMLYYTLRRLGLEDDGTPRSYPKQVVLANLDQVSALLPTRRLR